MRLRVPASLLLVALLSACACKTPSPVYQYAAFDAFAAGEYAGTMQLGIVKSHGDLGLGTVDGLSGELIVLDGKFYLADGQCRLTNPDPATLTPFAEVVRFRPQGKASIGPIGDMAALGAWLDERLPKGTFAAARIPAHFSKLTIRSVPGFRPPYPPLGEAIGSQHVEELANISGTLVGLRGPSGGGGSWVQGWHFHFVADGGQTGGHVLKGDIESGQAAWMSTPAITLQLSPVDGKGQ